MTEQRAWAQENLQKLIAFRRELHMYPEPTGCETATHRRLRGWLDEMGVPYLAPQDNMTIAVLEGKKGDGPVTGIRCDTDALEVTELTGAPYASRNGGVMHACGHDAHMAMGLGLAMFLKGRLDQMRGTVKIIFQPAEEGGGGAKACVGTGLLNDVQAFLALHVWPQLLTGDISISDGPVCSCTDTLRINVHGRGGHGAYPDLCRDAVTASAAMVTALQQVVSRFVPPMQPVVLTIGKLHAGTRWNVVAEEAVLEGTLRTFDDALRESVIARIGEIVQHTALAGQCTAELHVEDQTGLVYNDAALAEKMRAAAQDATGRAPLRLAPAMIGDDFSEYRAIAPSCYGLLGVGVQGRENPPLHHGAFTLDEEALALGTAYFCKAVCALHGMADA